MLRLRSSSVNDAVVLLFGEIAPSVLPHRSEEIFLTDILPDIYTTAILIDDTLLKFLVRKD